MAELYIYEEIGPSWWGLIDAMTVIRGLKEIDPDEPVTVRINSPGGSVHEGIAIYNALARHPGGVTVAIDAVAASAASYIAMAGQTISIAENAFLMIHDPYTITMGTAEQLRKTADVLDEHKIALANTYSSRSGQDRAVVDKWMSDETWFTAAEAKANGLADEITETSQAVARIRPGAFAKPPEKLVALPKVAAKVSLWKPQAARAAISIRRLDRR